MPRERSPPKRCSNAAIRYSGRASANLLSVQTYHAAGLAGIGLIQAGYSALARYLESGALVEVLPDLRPEPLAASLVVAHRRNLSPRVRAFMDWIEGVLEPYFD